MVQFKWPQSSFMLLIQAITQLSLFRNWLLGAQFKLHSVLDETPCLLESQRWKVCLPFSGINIISEAFRDNSCPLHYGCKTWGVGLIWMYFLGIQAAGTMTTLILRFWVSYCSIFVFSGQLQLIMTLNNNKKHISVIIFDLNLIGWRFNGELTVLSSR